MTMYGANTSPLQTGAPGPTLKENPLVADSPPDSPTGVEAPIIMGGLSLNLHSPRAGAATSLSRNPHFATLRRPMPMTHPPTADGPRRPTLRKKPADDRLAGQKEKDWWLEFGEGAEGPDEEA